MLLLLYLKQANHDDKYVVMINLFTWSRIKVSCFHTVAKKNKHKKLQNVSLDEYPGKEAIPKCNA